MSLEYTVSRTLSESDFKVAQTCPTKLFYKRAWLPVQSGAQSVPESAATVRRSSPEPVHGMRGFLEAHSRTVASIRLGPSMEAHDGRFNSSEHRVSPVFDALREKVGARRLLLVRSWRGVQARNDVRRPEGRIYFAGDQTLRGWMQGAIRSGLAASKGIRDRMP
jgi:hypothetical protein